MSAVLPAQMPLFKDASYLLDMPLRAGPAPYELRYSEAGAFLHLTNLERPLVWKLALPRIPVSKDNLEETSQGFSPYGDRFSHGFAEPMSVDASPADGLPPADPVRQGKAEFGLQSPDEHEYFLSGDGLAGIVRLKRKEGGDWSAQLSKTNIPRVLSSEAVSAGIMPPTGHSGLPASLEAVVPEEYHYWKASDPTEAKSMRDALVESAFFTDDCVKAVNGELRKVETKYYLYEPKAKGMSRRKKAAPRTVGEKVLSLLPADALVLPNPFDGEGDWLEKLDEQDNVGKTVILSPQTNDVSPREIARAVATLKSSWLIDVNDGPKAREALSAVGPVFKLKGEPFRLFASSFAPANITEVEFLDQPTLRGLGEVAKMRLRKASASKSIEFQGITISIDRPKGYVQTGKDVEGNEWSRTYQTDYGFIPRTKGGDGEALDVFVGPNDKSTTAYWASQRKADGTFDEYKLFVGYDSMREALNTYAAHIPQKYLIDMEPVSLEKIKSLLSIEPVSKLLELVPLTKGKWPGYAGGEARPKKKRKVGKAEISFDQIRTMLNEQLREKLSPGEGAPGAPCGPCPYICDIYDDSAVYDYEGKLYRVPYALSETGAQLSGEPAEVMRAYVPVGQAAQPQAPAGDQPEPTGDTEVQDSAPAGKAATIKRGIVTKDEGADAHYILGIVLEPDVVDAQNDTYSADEVQQAEQRFMIDFRNIGLMHKGHINEQVKIVESYIAPVDFQLGEESVKKGTWLMGVKVLDQKLWKACKEGDYTGFSIGGSAIRKPVATA
jgi:hypothetical protein